MVVRFYFSRGRGRVLKQEFGWNSRASARRREKGAPLLLCGFDCNENDQQNDPAHQRNDV